MNGETTKPTKGGRKPKARKFYEMNVNLAQPPGMEIENLQTLRQGRSLLSQLLEPGFPPLPEVPRFVIDRKLGRPPRDMEENEGYWVISDHMKSVLEAVDREAFAFVNCEVRLRNGEPGPGYWLCEVMRVLDAVDEAASKVKIHNDGGDKVYFFAGETKLFFKEEVVGSAHVFRMKYRVLTVICDQAVKDACRQAGLKGIQFRDALDL